MMTWLLFFSLSSSCEATAAPAAVAVQKKTSRKRKLQQHRQQQQQQHTRDAKETHYCGIHTHAHTACGARRSKLISSRPSVWRPCNYWFLVFFFWFCGCWFLVFLVLVGFFCFVF